MAADVHDLIMQDLAFALAAARTLASDPALAPRASAVVAAGERALAGARDVVSGLVSCESKPVVEAVEAAVRTAARRALLTFDAGEVPSCAHPDQPTREALVHIGREAVTNAVKHADPIAVVEVDPVAIEVVLAYAEEWRLTVRDGGRGFDAARTRTGLGLESMRARAHALGGSLRVTSAAGEGTTVEATLP